MLSSSQISKIKNQRGEIEDHQFIAASKIKSFVNPTLARRLKLVLPNLNSPPKNYLEDGKFGN